MPKYTKGVEDAERVLEAHRKRELETKRKEKSMPHDPKDPDLDEENDEENRDDLV